jgi:serine/threonine protein kinase
MSLSTGTKLGAYKILSALGAGGMGEVYRARDTKLNRDVAIKVLLPAVANDPDRLARFSREAQVLASLNHPNIAHIYGIEDAAIVMELVEGEDLAQRISRGPIPLDEALPIARQIAEALEAAHDHGIIHRDLKPANIKVRPDGTVKVLDFGLAKAVDPAAGSSATAMNSPTLSIHATEAGVILGTAAYMSPEQARGKAVDKRTDIWALGCVSFEMLTGQRAFQGDDATDTIVAVVSKEPDWSALPPAVSAHIRKLLQRCLEKDPKRRLDSAAAIRIEIDDAPNLPNLPNPPNPPNLPWAVALVAALAAVAATSALVWRGPPVTTDIATPPMTFSRLTMQPGLPTGASLSPDGKWLLYVNAATGNPDIYLQATTGHTSINLTKDSTATDVMPVFSPDGESIAFRSSRDGGGIFIMGRTGESVRRLTQRGFNPVWFPDGKQVVFATEGGGNVETRGDLPSELWIVAAAGGEPRLLFTGDAVQPRVSPHARRIAFWGLPAAGDPKRFSGNTRDIWTIGVDGSNPVRVTEDAANDWNPVWSPDGRWLYFLSNRAGSMNLWRIAVDETSGAPTGEPQALTVPATYIRDFSLSADGRLAMYVTSAPTSNIARVRFDVGSATVQGPFEPLTSGTREFILQGVSPDGRQLATTNGVREQEDIYLMGSDGRGLRQLTNDPGRNRQVQWSPDGTHLYFYSDRSGNMELWIVNQDGSGLRQLTTSDGTFYPSPTPDGSKVAALSMNPHRVHLYHARDFSKPAEMLPAMPSDVVPAGTIIQDWSPDGKMLLFTNSGGPLVYSVATRTYRRIPMGNVFPSWLPDSRRLLISSGRLSVFDLMSGEQRDVFAIPGEGIGSGQVSRDGYLYFTRGTSSGDIWTVRFDEIQNAAMSGR